MNQQQAMYETAVEALDALFGLSITKVQMVRRLCLLMEQVSQCSCIDTGAWLCRT